MVILFGAEMWFLSTDTEKQVAGSHTLKKRKVTGNGQRGVRKGPVNRRG